MANEKKYNVAVVGANGAVGEEILTILQEIDFPLNKLVPLASARSIGKTVEFNGKSINIQELTNDIFKEKFFNSCDYFVGPNAYMTSIDMKGFSISKPEGSGAMVL